MTDELLALLRRVHAAGGPVEVNASGEVAFVQLSPRCEATLVDLEVDSREQPRNDAPLIHALRLDARERGIIVQEVTDRRADGGGYDVQFDPLVWGASGRHENEVCAWLLAWLDAFEDTK